MSNLTRWDITELLKQFKAVCAKIEETDGPLPHPTGILAVEEQLKREEGAPSLKLRTQGKLLKHYLEEARKKPSAVIAFNVAAPQVTDQNIDVHAIIRRTKQALKQTVTQMEQEGLCTAADHTALRVDKHSRTLQQILEG